MCVCLSVHIINPTHFSKMRCVFMRGQKAALQREKKGEKQEDAFRGLK